MNYDLAQLMKKALVQNSGMTKTAQEEKHPLQVSFEEKHGVSLLDVLNRKLRLAENDEIEKDLIFMIKELILPNESMSTPDYFAENWGDSSGEVSVSSVYQKLNNYDDRVIDKMDDGMFSRYTPDIEDVIEEVSDYDEKLAEYIKYFRDNNYHTGFGNNENSMKSGIHPELLEKISEYQNK